MEKDPLALATRLLVKAQGTTFDAEAAALTGKAYRLLAEALKSYEDRAAPTGAIRKRERRLLATAALPPGPPIRVGRAGSPNRRGSTFAKPTGSLCRPTVAST